MNVLFFVGIAAACLTTFSFLPQVIKAYKTKQTKDLSVHMYFILSAGLILWTVYGIMLRQAPIIIANIVTLGLCIYLMVLKARHG
jgi:MtN3 and saliva related transmembrane protein